MREAHPHSGPARPMSLPRMHLNAVLLPDRTVFVSGGALATRRTGSPCPAGVRDLRPRDRRVAASGRGVDRAALPLGGVAAARRPGRGRGREPAAYGDQVAWEPQDENEELRLEVYSPPYLFAGPRPVISAVPTEWTYGQQLEIGTPQAGRARWLSLIRPGSTTHAFDNSQRLVDLPITDAARHAAHRGAQRVHRGPARVVHAVLGRRRRGPVRRELGAPALSSP